MHIHIIAWIAFAGLLLLALPFAGTRKLVLEVCAWGVRLAIVALLIGGMAVFYQPNLMPREVVNAVASSPELSNVLPSPEAPYFGICAASLAAVLLLPCLAMLDVTRKLAGDRLRRLRRMTEDAPTLVASEPLPLPAPLPTGVSEPPLPARAASVRRQDRRAAADTMAQVGTRRVYRVADDT